MKFISWNVNGLRACVNKGFMDSFHALDADFFCLQETKLQEGQINLDLPGYHQYWCYAEKKGYSGTAIFTKYQPESVTYGIGVPELDTEGRVICLEYPEFYLVTCYTPNAQRGLARIDHRLRWEEAFRCYLQKLDNQKPVILCGDLNVAHKEIDLKNPSSNRGNAGFSDQERDAFTKLLDTGFTDSFRHLYPDKTGAYSWWSYMFNARANNAGWRIDYFVVSDRIASQIYDATIHPDVLGSDHCPVGLDLDITCNGSLPIPTPTFNSQTDATKEADVDSPVGFFHIRSLLCGLLLLAGLLCIPIALFYGMSPPKQQRNTPPATTTIIHEIIDRTGNIQWTMDILLQPRFAPPLSHRLTSDNESWNLFGGEEHIISLQNMTFCIQLVFDPTQSYTPETAPNILSTYGNLESSHLEPHSVSHCYYWEDGRILGCFLFGTILKPISLTVLASDESRSEQPKTINIEPLFDAPLIGEIINYPSSIELRHNPFSSYLGNQFSLIYESQTWYATELHKHLDTLTWKPNFFIQIAFPYADFTVDNHPRVFVVYAPDDTIPEDQDFQYEIVYYHTNGNRIEGAFIFGYSTMHCSKSISVSYTDYYGMSHRSYGTIIIDPDYTSMTTADLAHSLRYSQELSYCISLGLDANLHDLLENSQAFHELLQRPDALDTILYVNGYSEPGTNFDVLLKTDCFQHMMTQEQIEEFHQQVDREGPLYYPTINPAWPSRT